MLNMDHVTKYFGDFKALDDLSLNVKKGTVYGLVGPNGAGKSTAIRHLTGIFRPDSGSVTLEGQPVEDDPNVKERIGFIPDEIFYFPTSTQEDMHRFYRQLYSKFDEHLYQKLKKRSSPCPPAPFGASPRACRNRLLSIWPCAPGRM